MHTVNIVGFSAYSIPMFFDMAYEIAGIKHFNIFKNIPVENPLQISINSSFYDYQIYEPNEWVEPLDGSKFIFGLTNPKGKCFVFNDFNTQRKIQQADFINLIHPSSSLATSIALKTGIIIQQSAIVASQTQIDFGVTIKRGVNIGHHNHIEEYVEINPGVTTAGAVTIGRGSKIGVGAIVKDNIKIGTNSFIGMGSLVNKDIPDGVIAYGNPCKVIRENDLWHI